MSREIKFRAWDGKRMIFFDTLEVAFQKTDQGIMAPHVHFANDTFDGYASLNRHEVMQYTGLKDKNGVDVYEGDVVRVLYSDWPSMPRDYPGSLEQYQIEISKIGEIVFEGYEWCVKNGDNYGTFIVGRHGWMEVIGNIYSNPELIQR